MLETKGTLMQGEFALLLLSLAYGLIYLVFELIDARTSPGAQAGLERPSPLRPSRSSAQVLHLRLKIRNNEAQRAAPAPSKKSA